MKNTKTKLKHTATHIYKQQKQRRLCYIIQVFLSLVNIPSGTWLEKSDFPSTSRNKL